MKASIDGSRTSPNLPYRKVYGKIPELTIGQYYTDSWRQEALPGPRSSSLDPTAQQHGRRKRYRTAGLSEFCQYLSRCRAVYDALETEAAAVGAGDGSGPVKPKALDAYTASSKWTAPAGEPSGWEVVALSVDERQAGRTAVLRKVSQEVGAKVRDVADGVCTVAPGHLACHAKTIDEPDNPVCCWRCGKRDCRSTRIEHDEGRAGAEQAEQGRLEERQDGEGLRFAIPARASSIVTPRAMNMACRGGRGEAVPAHTHDKRVEGNEREDPTVLPTLRECMWRGSTGSKLTTTSHIAITRSTFIG
jgi:hypothetical protein